MPFTHIDLEMAERHVVDGQECIERQKRVLAELDRDGHSTDKARALLAELERTQREFEAHLELIKASLAKA